MITELLAAALAGAGLMAGGVGVWLWSSGAWQTRARQPVPPPPAIVEGPAPPPATLWVFDGEDSSQCRHCRAGYRWHRDDCEYAIDLATDDVLQEAISDLKRQVRELRAELIERDWEG